jgi:cation diffusion facilitator CzcD-associated flavoprotein CzcO
VTPSTGGDSIPEAERWLLMNVPSYAQWARLHTFLRIGDANYSMVRYDPEWVARHELSISAANERGLQVALGHLEQTFADRPDLVEKLKPNFAFMGKRPIRDPGAYYETLKKPTTEVVTGGLAQVTPRGPVDCDGNVHEVDAIVYATGFALDFLSSWTIVGRNGRKLADVWREAPAAYLGCQVPGFPNLFVTSGPNANPSHGGGHNFCVEAVVHYVIECLNTLVERGAQSMEPTPEALDDWVKEMREQLADSVWVRETRATTYYRNAKGDVVLANPLRMEDYWNRLRHPQLDELCLR